MWPFFYNTIAFPLLWLLARIAAIKNQKIKDSIEGKKQIWERLESHLKNRDFDKKLIWFHVPSAGEFLQAQPLLERFLDNGYQCAVTFASISAEKWIRKATINSKNQPLFLDYIPFDFKDSIRRWVKRVKPTALVFVKFDLWPNMIWETSKLGIPLYLVSATLHAKTNRYKSTIGRSLYKNLYAHFKTILTVGEDDKSRFLETTPGIDVRVKGDTRFDSVINRRDRQNPPELPEYFKNNRIFIVGSSWPPDEKCIYPFLKESLEKYEDLKLILAPHEPTEEHLLESENYFKDHRLARLSEVLNGNSKEDLEIILVDSVGVLSSLYHIGTFAYVGGGFTTGVHNVMEPAATGLPVFFGPIHYNSPEALKLVSDQLAYPVNKPEEFRESLGKLLSNQSLAEDLGKQSQKFVESQAGATLECFNIISKDIDEN